MKTKDVLQLDCRIEENQKIIQRVLRQIKPLAKFSESVEIPLSAIEKALFVMYHKYGIKIHTMWPSCDGNSKQAIWCSRIMAKDGVHILDSVYGISVYETVAKSAIRIYAEIRQSKGV